MLVHLNIADGIFILGSTESHYTPSKSFQAVLSKRPLIAALHNESTAIDVLRNSNVGKVMGFKGERDMDLICDQFAPFFIEWKESLRVYDASKIDFDAFQKYSAFNVTAELVKLLNKITDNT